MDKLDILNKNKFCVGWLVCSINLALEWVLKDHFKLFVSQFINRELVVKGTYKSLSEDIGHYPHWEDPDGFIAAYEHFLSKVMPEK